MAGMQDHKESKLESAFAIEFEAGD